MIWNTNSASSSGFFGLISAAFGQASLILIRNGLIIPGSRKKIDKIKNGSELLLLPNFPYLPSSFRMQISLINRFCLIDLREEEIKKIVHYDERGRAMPCVTCWDLIWINKRQIPRRISFLFCSRPWFNFGSGKKRIWRLRDVCPDSIFLGMIDCDYK